MSPGELVCVFTYITILLALGDLAVETGILTQSQSEMFRSYRQTMIHYAADSLVHNIVVDLSRMVRVYITSLTPKKREVEGGGKSSQMAYGEEETLIAINSNAGKKQVAARLRSYRDCMGRHLHMTPHPIAPRARFRGAFSPGALSGAFCHL